MKSVRKPLRALFFAALLGCSLAAQQSSPPQTQAAATSVSLVVFSDFECPYSAQLNHELDALQRKNGESLHVLYKNLPLALHPGAPLAHRAALAAANQGQYRAMAALLYASGTHHGRDELLSFARQLHLDLPRFTRDLDSPDVQRQIDSDRMEADALGVATTPTVFVNGERLSGVQGEAVLEAAIRKVPAPATTANAPATVEAKLDPQLTQALQRGASGQQQGNAAAPITLVEFTDFQCPFCRKAVDPVKQMLAARGQQVRWVYRAFPLDFHEHAQLAAEAAFAAGAQGRFNEMYDLLFQHQDALTPEDLRRYATQLSLDMRSFDEALRTHAYAGRVAADHALGERAGVDGTPAFFLDGERTSGVRSVTELVAWVDAHAAGGTRRETVATNDSAAPTQDDLIVQEATGANPVTLTWFTDVRSPLAGKQATLVRALATQADGKLRIVVRPFPLSTHADGALSAAALFASAQQHSFWPVFQAIADRRDVLDRQKLMEIAATLKLDTAAFDKAMAGSDSALESARDEAQRRGVLGTPVIFIGSTRVDGLQPLASYQSLLAQQLPALTASR